MSERGSLTVRSRERATQPRHRVAATHYEPVRQALVVSGLGLGENHVLHVQPRHNADKMHVNLSDLP